MKADLTRDTFDPLKRYTRVLMQQGRVQLDADWNEQVAISVRLLRALAADLIGHAGGPAHNVGFQISAAGLYPDFRIGSGHYYVDGILCEADTGSIPIVPQPDLTGVFKVYLPTLIVDDVAFYKPKSGLPPQYVEIYDADNPTQTVIGQVKDVDLSKQTLIVDKNIASVLKTKPRLRRVLTYLTQPDYPVPTDEQFPQSVTASKGYLVYLDVWERLVTCIEDDSIREVALGGADTATRAKVVWQVKVVPGTVVAGPYGSACDGFRNDQFFAGLDPANRGQLKAMAKQDTQATDPCITPPQARYRGVENQLYRVEIHNGGNAWDGSGDPPEQPVATFKWSRENGSVVYPIRQLVTDATAQQTTVTLETLGRDERFGLVEGDWVEIVDDDYVLQNLAQPLLQVQAIDRSSLSVTLAGVAAVEVGQQSGHPLLRRWDHKAGDPDDGDVQVAGDGAAFVLEQTGDAWLNLEDGVRIQFQPKNPSDVNDRYRYKTGDYWLIPARTATGDVEWPSVKDPQSGLTLPVALPPKGIQHHYAPLAVATVGSGSAGTTITFANCRKQFATQAQNFVYDYAGGSAGIGAGQLKKRRARGPQP